MLLQFLIRAVVVLAVLWLALRWFEWSAIYAPTRALESTPEREGLAYEDVTFVTEDGRLLHGWWIPHPAARGTILYCHGNASNIGNRVGACRDLHRLGANVFVFDYRGYGRSKGWPTERGTYRDARAAYEVVRARYGDVEDPPVIVYGASLGGAIAVQLAVDKPVRGLVVENSFTSAADVGAHLYPWLPTRLLSTFRYDSEAKIGRVTVPKLFASSLDDQLIPFELGRRLYEAAGEPRQFFQLRGPHDEASWTTTPGFWPVLEHFVTRVLGPMAVAEDTQ